MDDNYCACISLQKLLTNIVNYEISYKWQKSFESRALRLQKSWNSILQHPTKFSDICKRTVFLLYRYSLQVVLNPNWQPNSFLSKNLRTTLDHLYAKSSWSVVRRLCHSLKEIVLIPWKNPILAAIICPGTTRRDKDKVRMYLKNEGGIMLWARLEILCEKPNVTRKFLKHHPLQLKQSKKISPALNYATEVLQYLTNSGKLKEDIKDIDEYWAGCPTDFRDACLALLAREGRTDILRHYMFKKMSLSAISEMQERTRSWSGHLPPSLASQATSVNFHANEVAAGITLSHGRLSQELPLLRIVGRELALGSLRPAHSSKALKRIKTLASRGTAGVECQPTNIFLIANRLAQINFHSQYTAICLKLCVMGLKMVLSRRQVCRPEEMTEEEEATLNTQLALIFCQMSELFSTQWLVKRELLLTAFSLDPNEQQFSKLLQVARQSGKSCSATGCTIPFSDSWCQKTAAHSLCSSCGRFGNQGTLHTGNDVGSLVWFPPPVLVNSYRLLDPPQCHMLDNKSLGISKKLAEQIVNMVSTFRYKELSWALHWSQLYSLCMNYMKSKGRSKRVQNDLIFAKMDCPLYQCLQQDNKIKALKRKLADDDDDISEEVIQRKKMNVDCYCYFRRRINSIEATLSVHNIIPVSSESCHIFGIKNTVSGFERLCEIRRAMIALCDNSTDEIVTSSQTDNLKTKVENLIEMQKMEY